ncbi:hypothetical protein TYRP_000514 [Tyrophagus putrescentiae]|nr:hypothetical protein TYRP_000514 [Tyrophagus putrescentiae]
MIFRDCPSPLATSECQVNPNSLSHRHLCILVQGLRILRRPVAHSVAVSSHRPHCDRYLPISPQLCVSAQDRTISSSGSPPLTFKLCPTDDLVASSGAPYFLCPKLCQ